MTSGFTQDWSWTFPVARDRLWPYLADTDWINRHAGLPRIAVRYRALPEGGTLRIASFRRGPVLVEWEERPTVWRVPEFFEVERLYTSGPLARFANRTALHALDDVRTRVDVRIELEATGPLFERLLPLVAAQGKRGADRAFTLAARLAGGAEPARGADVAERQRFAVLRDFGIEPSVVDALADYVGAAEDRELARMQPYALADRWELPRRDVLRGFLAATRAELFDLQWSVLCPGCRGPSAPLDSLAQLRPDAHCDACNIPFDAVFDRSVEVTFSARPIRHRVARAGLYCIANPHGSAHVLTQRVLDPGASDAFQLALPRGAYQVTIVGAGVTPFFAVDEPAPPELSIGIGDGPPLVDATVGAGEARVVVRNTSSRTVTVRVEAARWADTLVTAAHVTALQEFRELFSSEVLVAGIEVGIESVTVLFSDLIGSTAMYTRTGDAPAFRIVTDHFAAIREIVARHDGAIVKTIGDAVMAAFVDPLQALEAALQLDGRVGAIEVAGAPLRLRVGLHAGPCIAMNANARIDYFGTSVNLAARMQALAGPGEVVVARGFAERPAIAARLAQLDAEIARESRTVRGFAHPVEVVRIASRGVG